MPVIYFMYAAIL